MAAILVAELVAVGRAVLRFCHRISDWFRSRLLCFLLETSKVGRLASRRWRGSRRESAVAFFVRRHRMKHLRTVLLIFCGLAICLPIGWCLRGRSVAAKEALLHNLVEIEKAQQQMAADTNKPSES